jgi:enoyl-CoA hydratase/carnithine racemase
MTHAPQPAVLVTRANGVATLTLNRPAQYNALSGDLLATLQAELDALAAEPDLRCVVLAAAGKAFCAGHDLREMSTIDKEADHRALFARCSAVMMSLRALPVPVIAKVRGVAAAAGCQLVAACDLAVAAASARFAVSGINLGLFCSTPAVALSRTMPTKAAFDMLVTGRFIDAASAEALGLVNSVTADDDLDAAVAAYADVIAAKSAEAVRIGKRMFYRQQAMDLEEAYRFAGLTMARNMASADARAGIGAFLDKGR